MNRRTFSAIAAAIPLVPVHALAAQGSPVPSTGVPPSGIPGEVLSISPDAALVLVRTADAGLAMIDTTSGDEVATAPESPHIRAIDPQSISWKPDSSGVAFAVQAFQQLLAGVIVGLNVGDTDLTALTGQIDADLRIELGKDFVTDTGPVWGEDDLWFVRSSATGGNQRTAIVQLDPISGSETEIALLSTTMFGASYGPMMRTDDGSLVCIRMDSASETEIVRVTADGVVRPVFSGIGDGPAQPYQLQSIGGRGTRFLVHDVRSFETWIGDTESEAGWTSLQEEIGLDTYPWAVLHPDDARIATLEIPTGEVMVHDASGSRAIGTLEGFAREGGHFVTGWQGETVLIASGTSSWLVESA